MAVDRPRDAVVKQESRRETLALKRLLASLGPHWQAPVSDVAEGTAGNGELLAFLYDSMWVQPSVLLGEIVLPPTGDEPLNSTQRESSTMKTSKRRKQSS